MLVQSRDLKAWYPVLTGDCSERSVTSASELPVELAEVSLRVYFGSVNFLAIQPPLLHFPLTVPNQCLLLRDCGHQQ
jgi:hypothetical protein